MLNFEGWTQTCLSQVEKNPYEWFKIAITYVSLSRSRWNYHHVMMESTGKYIPNVMIMEWWFRDVSLAMFGLIPISFKSEAQSGAGCVRVYVGGV